MSKYRVTLENTEDGEIVGSAMCANDEFDDALYFAIRSFDPHLTAGWEARLAGVICVAGEWVAHDETFGRLVCAAAEYLKEHSPRAAE